MTGSKFSTGPRAGRIFRGAGRPLKRIVHTKHHWPLVILVDTWEISSETVGDDVLESQQFIYQYPLTHVEFDATIILESLRNVFGVRDFSSQEDRDVSEESPPAKRK